MPYLIKETHERVEDKDGNITERCIQEWGYTDQEKKDLEHMEEISSDTDTDSECELFWLDNDGNKQSVKV